MFPGPDYLSPPCEWDSLTITILGKVVHTRIVLSSNKQACNYDTEWSSHQVLMETITVSGLQDPPRFMKFIQNFMLVQNT